MGTILEYRVEAGLAEVMVFRHCIDQFKLVHHNK